MNFISILIAFLLCSATQAMDIKKLANNKESSSKQLTEFDTSETQEWINSHFLQGSLLKEKIRNTLQFTFDVFIARDNYCDLDLQKMMQQKALNEKIIQNVEEFKFLINSMRMDNLIDDILYKILNDSYGINDKIANSMNERASRPMNLYTRNNEDADVKALYSDFKVYPDEITSCSIGLYFKIAGAIPAKNANDRSRQLKRLNYLAYAESVIDLTTYNRLEVLRQEDALEWPTYTRRYLDILNNAKDKMAQGVTSLVSTNGFSSKYASRKEELTKRGRLYRNFDSTQVVMLAQLIEKAGKRRDAFSAVLTFQYTEASPESENYVLSPMEKFRASIKMLRNDMGALMRSENFSGNQIQYEDLISAAYETGLIKDEELDHILKFEEMWNPKTPKWKAYVNFAFSLAGTTAFYLPPPFNLVGALALVFTQTKIGGGKKDPNPEDNWNIII